MVGIQDKEFRKESGIAMFMAKNVGAAMFAVIMEGINRKPDLLEGRVLLSKQVVINTTAVIIDEEFWH